MNTEYIDVNQGDTYIDKFGVEYSSDKKRLIKGCNIEHYIVMEGTEIICDYAFKSLNIKNIVLPDSLKAIGACAFANNESLETINIPSSVEYIRNNNPFGGCTNLKNIKVHSPHFILENNLLYSSDYRILYSAFNTSTSSININKNTIEISANCFWNYPQLSVLEIPDSVETIGRAAFYGTKIDYLKLSFNLRTIGEWAFAHSCCKNILIGTNITHIKEYAFSSTCGLSQLDIKHVEFIGKYAFASCHDLSSVVLNGPMTELASSSFSYCENLKKIVLSNNLKKICDNALYETPSLESVKIQSNIEEVEVGNFHECYNLKEIIVPSKFYFSIYDIICQVAPNVAGIVCDGIFATNEESKLSQISKELCNAYVASCKMETNIGFNYLKPYLQSFSKEIKRIGWFNRVEHRNYYLAGRASHIHTLHLNRKLIEQVKKGCICSLNDLGLAYVYYSDYQMSTEQDMKIRSESSILIMSILIEFQDVLTDIIDECLASLGKEKTDMERNIFIAYICEFLFSRAVDVDNQKQDFIPHFEERADLIPVHFYRQRYVFINKILKFDPVFFDHDDFKQKFEVNYTTLMKIIREHTIEISKFDYDDLLVTPMRFLNKLYFDSNNYVIL